MTFTVPQDDWCGIRSNATTSSFYHDNFIRNSTGVDLRHLSRFNYFPISDYPIAVMSGGYTLTLHANTFETIIHSAQLVSTKVFASSYTTWNKVDSLIGPDWETPGALGATDSTHSGQSTTTGSIITYVALDAIGLALLEQALNTQDFTAWAAGVLFYAESGQSLQSIADVSFTLNYVATKFRNSVTVQN